MMPTYTQLSCASISHGQSERRFSGLQCLHAPPTPASGVPPTVSSLNSSPTSLPSLQPCWPPGEPGTVHLRVLALAVLFAWNAFALIPSCLPPLPYSHLCPNSAFLARPLPMPWFIIQPFRSSRPDPFFSHITRHLSWILM